MSSIGPQLPPHLSKRKRSSSASPPTSPRSKAARSNKDEIALDNDDSDSDDGYGPSAPRATTASIGPTMPPPPQPSNEIPLDDSDSDNTGPALPAPPPPSSRTTAPVAAPKRVMGPAPPPADPSERPPTSPSPLPPNAAPDSNSESDSDDDYGPALPGSKSHLKNSRGATSFPQASTEPQAPKRDDWMLAPPTGNTGYQERDPTKIKARKFASGPRPKAGGGDGGISSIWTETPEEKAKRLKDAVLGRGSDAQQSSSAAGGSRGSRVGGGSNSKHQHDKIRSFTEQTRGQSLYEEHQAAKKAGKATNSGGARKGGDDDEEDDDPSKRAFDREKDMGLGGKINASQRKELLNRASDFGGRFSKGNYL